MVYLASSYRSSPRAADLAGPKPFYQPVLVFKSLAPEGQGMGGSGRYIAGKLLGSLQLNALVKGNIQKAHPGSFFCIFHQGGGFASAGKGHYFEGLARREIRVDNFFLFVGDLNHNTGLFEKKASFFEK